MKLTFLKSAIIAVGIAIVGTTAYTATSISSFVAPLVMALGGTGSVLTPNSGGVIYSTGSQLAIGTPGSTGAPLLSNGASPPTFGSDINLAYLDKTQAYSKGQATTPATIASCGGSITPDGTTSNTYTCVLTSNVALQIPAVMTPGYQLNFRFIQPSSAAGKTLTPVTQYKFAGGIQPTLSSTANAIDTLSCTVASSTEIDCGALQANLGNNGTSNPAVVLAAPITPNTADSSNLNYATGCNSNPGGAAASFTNHSCLIFDDHWTTTPTSNVAASTLNLTNWYAGYYRCNGGTGGNANCLQQVLSANANFSNPIDYPFSAWCFANSNGCFVSIIFDYPFGTSVSHSLNNTSQIVGDGSLDLVMTFYDNATAVADSNCFTDGSNANVNCSAINWIGGGITTGGLASPDADNNKPTTTTTLIPASGGIFQVRMKADSGLNAGSYPGIECDAVDGANNVNGNSSNANFEFGYTNGGATTGVQGIGQGLNNVANQVVNQRVTTGNDGVGAGDNTFWHTFALEYTGTATHQWNYYVDGVPLPVGATANSHNEVNLPDTGYTCSVTLNMAPTSGDNSFHSVWNPAAPGGPFNLWISDAQVYKRPGT